MEISWMIGEMPSGLLWCRFSRSGKLVMGVGLNKVHNKSVCDECLAGVVERDDVPVG